VYQYPLLIYVRSGWTVPLALVAMSLEFFFIALAPLLEIVLRAAGTPSGVMSLLSSLLWNNTLFCVIALCGGVVVLLATRNENPSWYLGIPLVAAYALIAAAPFLGQIFVVYDADPPLYHPGVLVMLIASYGALFLLPPCAALFFWSQKRQGRWAQAMAGIALVVALNSFILMFYVLSPYLVSAGLLPPAQPHIPGQPMRADGEGIVFLLLGYLIGLPALGLCILALAVLRWRDAHRAVTPPQPPAAERP
jgi:hypothetical protein